jgi:hypothetical protein
MRRRSARSTLARVAAMTAMFVVASVFASPSVGAATACSLVFVAQPADNVVPSITSVPFTKAGAPVRVECQSSPGMANPGFRAIVTLTLSTNTTKATLSNNTARAVDGVATFPGLSVDRSGHFVLRATAPNAQSGDSNPFTIWDDACGENAVCSATFPTSGTAFQHIRFTNPTNALVTLANGIDDDPNCSVGSFVDPFFHAAVTWTVDEGIAGTTSGTITATARITKAWRKEVEDRGITSYRVCGAVPAAAGATSPPSFIKSWNNSPITLVNGEWVFLFPDCTDLNQKFCMASVKSTKTGDIVETVITSATGDPKHR